MKQGIYISIFVVLGAIIIAWAAWYADTSLLATGPQQTANQQASAAATINPSTTQPMDNLKITDTTVGTGAVAANGDTVTVNYVGTLDNGTKFDSSFDRNQPFIFVLGAGRVIKGWDLGLLGMKVGGTRELVIPSDMGYGPSGMGPIPPNATLHFTVTLLSVSTATAGR